MENSLIETNELTQVVINPEELLEHWQGHRRVTRKTIEAFPEDKFTSYSIGGMRTFSAMTLELIDLAVPGLKGIVTDEWPAMGELEHNNPSIIKSKVEILKLWDESTERIDQLWKQIPASRFHDVIKAFGMYDGQVYSTILYFIDNEIHHRAQGYVYLRSLGIEPPFFWERG